MVLGTKSLVNFFHKRRETESDLVKEEQRSTNIPDHDACQTQITDENGHICG